ncbi:zinc-ribbon domain-containing protein [Lachnospiraceae bacterium NE2001]|nr:zinc-ribbon domain-containing protein [Lachnospiraceae bacterium NE2001]
MFCTKCGKSIADGSLFCEYCGSAVGQVGQPAQPQIQYNNASNAYQNNNQQNMGNAGAKGGKGPLIAVLSICGAVIIISLGILFYFIMKNKNPKTIEVEVSDYVKVEFNGYDGIGTANVTFDQDQFYEDYADDIKYAKEQPRDAKDYYDAAEYILYGCVSGTLDKTTGLSNGDTVTYIWDVDKSGIEKYTNVDLIYDDIPFTVKDLKEVGQTDVFQYVSVTFSGRDGKGKATITTTSGSPVEGWTFVADKMEDLSNGDTILVSANDDGTLVDSYVADTGTSPVSITREYTVSGLTEDVAINESSDPSEDLLTTEATTEATTAASTTTSSGGSSGGYAGMIIPDSDTRTLTDADVRRMTQDQIQTAINEIYARHGYKFKDQNIFNYFSQFDWYHPITTDQADAKRQFNSTENYNVELLQKYRN